MRLGTAVQGARTQTGKVRRMSHKKARPSLAARSTLRREATRRWRFTGWSNPKTLKPTVEQAADSLAQPAEISKASTTFKSMPSNLSFRVGFTAYALPDIGSGEAPEGE